jgi:hypothetical protein
MKLPVRSSPCSRSGRARHGGRPVAWLSLDAGDNDPARFWRHAVAALDCVAHHRLKRPLTALTVAGRRPVSPDICLRWLLVWLPQSR